MTTERERAIEIIAVVLNERFYRPGLWLGITDDERDKLRADACHILDALPAPEPQGLLTAEERKAVLMVIDDFRLGYANPVPMYVWHKENSETLESARAKIESPSAAPEQQALTAEEDRGWKPSDTPDPFLLRAADALYERCADLIRSHRVDARSPMGDALLDYRDVRDESAQRSIEGPPAPTITDEQVGMALIALMNYRRARYGSQPLIGEEKRQLLIVQRDGDDTWHRREEMRAALRAAHA